MLSMLKMKKVHRAYVSKHKSKREKQILLLMISNKEGWHYIAIQKLSALVIGIMSKHNGAFV